MTSRDREIESILLAWEARGGSDTESALDVATQIIDLNSQAEGSGSGTGPERSCEHCPDGHRVPGSKPMYVAVGPGTDSDGQPTHLRVGYTGGQHVSEHEAQWLRDLISSVGDRERLESALRIARDALGDRDRLTEERRRLAIDIIQQALTGSYGAGSAGSVGDERRVGRCGDRLDLKLMVAGMPPHVSFCELPFGHLGAHQAGETNWWNGEAEAAGVPLPADADRLIDNLDRDDEMHVAFTDAWRALTGDQQVEMASKWLAGSLRVAGPSDEAAGLLTALRDQRPELLDHLDARTEVDRIQLRMVLQVLHDWLSERRVDALPLRVEHELLRDLPEDAVQFVVDATARWRGDHVEAVQLWLKPFAKALADWLAGRVVETPPTDPACVVTVEIETDDTDGGYVATCRETPGAVGQGSCAADAVRDLFLAKALIEKSERSGGGANDQKETTDGDR